MNNETKTYFMGNMWDLENMDDNALEPPFYGKVKIDLKCKDEYENDENVRFAECSDDCDIWTCDTCEACTKCEKVMYDDSCNHILCLGSRTCKEIKENEK